MQAVAPRARDAPLRVDQQHEPQRDVPCHAGVIGRASAVVARARPGVSCAPMRPHHLALLSLVALGCGSAEPVSASPDAAPDAASPDVAKSADDAPEAPQDVAVDAAFDAAPDALSCAAGMTVCAASCVDVRSNPVHCGGCRRSCRSDESCVSGACVVPRDAGGDVMTIPRDAAPISDAASDAPRDGGDRPCVTVRDCGTIVTGRVPSCQAGQCVDVCPAEFADCDGNPINGCETRLDRAEACGACDRWCGRGGACVRFAGWFRCA